MSNTPYTVSRYMIPALAVLYCVTAYIPASHGHGLAIAASAFAVTAAVGVLSRRMPPTVTSLLVAAYSAAWFIAGLADTVVGHVTSAIVTLMWIGVAYRERDTPNERDWLQEHRP